MPSRKRPVSGNYADVVSTLDEVPVVLDYVHAIMDALQIPRARWWRTPAQEPVTFALAVVKVGQLVRNGLNPSAAIQQVSAELGMLPSTLARTMRRWRRAAGCADMMSAVDSRGDGIVSELGGSDAR